MATSTALRIRNRTDLSSIDLLDAIGNVESIQDRTLFDSIVVQDIALSIFEFRKAGDRIVSVTDATGDEIITRGAVLSDSIEVSDSTVLEKQQRKILTDVITARDDGFITDRDVLRYRVLFDQLRVTDKLQKSVTRGTFIINSRVMSDDLEVTDAKNNQFLGIVVKQLSDSVSVTDKHKKQNFHIVDVETLDVLDTTLFTAIRPRIYRDHIPVRDSVRVTRNHIETSAALTDTFTLSDRIVATKSNPGIGVAAPIITGVEVI